MSEPKIQSHHEKEKAGCPCSISSRDLGSLLQVFSGGEGEGNHRAPISPSSLERKRALREKMESGPDRPEPGEVLFGDWDSEAPGLLPRSVY